MPGWGSTLNEQGIVGFTGISSDLECGRSGQLIGFTFDKIIESKSAIQIRIMGNITGAARFYNGWLARLRTWDVERTSQLAR